MRHKLPVFFFLTFLTVVQPFTARDCNSQDGVISAGGGYASGGSYRNFSVLGEPLVNNQVAGTDLSSTIGFLYSMCINGIADTDNDGLPDFIEEGSCTDAADADSDDDGIIDGNEDANHNGLLDAGETDPCNIDTDGDGIQDGTEFGYTASDITEDTDNDIFQWDLDPATTTDPLDADSDDDGLSDGEEDTNLNGRTDAGESDPNICNLPEIHVLLGSIGIPVGGIIDFGTVAPGASVTLPFTISNLGNEILSLTGFPAVQLIDNDGGGFAVTVQPSALIEPNESVVFDIIFTPAAETLQRAQVSIANNGSDENPYTFIIRGNYHPVAVPAYAGPVPDTGQTLSYTGIFGEDSDYNINPLSYTKLDAAGNELSDDAPSWDMIRDNVTGLIWEAKTDDGSIHDRDNRYTWYDSNPLTNGGDAGLSGEGTDTEDFINSLNAGSFGGFADWRLPTVYELSFLVDRGEFDPAVEPLFFPDLPEDSWTYYYWSSTTRTTDSSLAWLTSFMYGRNLSGAKSSLMYVRAVRGKWPTSASAFVENHGTVTDTGSGLMWQQGTTDQMTWQEAISYCENLELSGYSDWRLPNQHELLSIKDFGSSYPAIDTRVFPDVISAHYWSSTTDVSKSDYAWSVTFADGLLDALKSWPLYVCAVRGGQNERANHLVIWGPRQASSWNVGSLMPIKWNTQDITGNVKISISRQGGKDGTFEPIVESTENDGSFDWKVIGPVSVNCMLKVELTDDPSKGTTQGLFTIIDQPLMLLLLLEDDGGTTSDSSRNGNDGIVNGADFLAGGGMLNSNAYRFSWSNQDNIQVPYQKSQTATEALAIEAWVYPTAWDNISYHYNRIVSKQPVYLLRGAANGHAHFQILTENYGYQGVYDSQVMSLNEWHYVVGTFDGLSLKLYVDGILRDSLELAEEDSISTNERDIFVGESPVLAEGFTGTIDNVAIYKRARSQSEIEKTYASIMLRCEGDFDNDKDVDGSDLATYAAGGTGITLEAFAADFGRTDCPD